ncbi:MAG: pilus assembly protein PilM [Patescibacteria group bacterium]|jgi:Tfp pilus assembly PilM family ATPase
MALFSSKKSFIGIDLGTSSIKVVELENEKGRPKLITYGFAEQSTDVIKSDSQEAQKEIVAALKAIISQAKVTTMKAVAALPSFAVFSSIISLPSMSKKDLVAAVRWEAKKFVPMPLEEMILDWKVLNSDKKEDKGAKEDEVNDKRINTAQPTGGSKNIRILLTAAPKTLVKRYVDIFKQANLQLVSLETESFALERSLIGNDRSATMIVDIGAIACDISVIVDGIPILNRSVDIGGNTITKAIANSLNVNLDRAEQFKRDFGISAAGDSSQGQIPRTIEFIVSSIINEIKFVLNLYQNQGERAIEKVVLAGGSSFLPNLTSYLEKALNIKVFIGDPWARVVYPVDLKPVLQELGPRFAVSIGLAMREII